MVLIDPGSRAEWEVGGGHNARSHLLQGCCDLRVTSQVPSVPVKEFTSGGSQMPVAGRVVW